MNKEHQEDIVSALEWLVDQLKEKLDIEKEEIVTVIENWCEENW